MADISRRSFLKTGTAAALGLSMIPGKVFADSEKRAPAPLNRKLKILGVGIGGRGASVLRGLETEEIIGLCDVDWKYAAHIFERYPNAKRYKDWRVMFDEMLDEADAVMVATADHTHAIIAANAIMAGKHVYCEKPLTRRDGRHRGPHARHHRRERDHGRQARLLREAAYPYRV